MINVYNKYIPKEYRNIIKIENFYVDYNDINIILVAISIDYGIRASSTTTHDITLAGNVSWWCTWYNDGNRKEQDFLSLDEIMSLFTRKRLKDFLV